jgi:hypothetical protein
MSLQVSQQSEVRHDGFGARHSTCDSYFGPVEVIELSSALGTPAAEQAIRASAARQSEATVPVLRRIVRITRSGETLSITSIAADGVTLSDLLAALEFGTVTLGDDAILALAGGAIAAVAAMHALPGSPAHGALSPSHIVVRADGSVVLTGAVFGDALQALQFNREQLWRIFGVALPPSASLPRFDQRADVTQLGAVVLAMLLRRTLSAAEYPKRAIDLVDDATAGLAVSPRCRSALRLWLQQTLQLQAKALFASAADAARAYGDVVADLENHRPATQQLQAAIRHLSGVPVAPEPAPIPVTPVLRAAFQTPAPTPPEPAAAPAVRGSFFRTLFPAVRAN